ncbi:ABC-type dipeptide/oligopeptide/nickel transport system, permease component [Arthrobacter sp. PAMC 25486]|uniref:ABC transporter permease n=1 Tax=Arthrobacter sp. PAMC 25486 TaxID=1494608 RepID=UPI000535AE35|nr:ABC transporter permease [Arthrobacter sp. PAMC 25486]AIY03413.1 ABC-type dipeptide/oligopeptide/nickel transport system, permease component [Arthrobacter sp. PAMC 25486]
MIGFIAKRFINYAILAAIATLSAYALASAILNPAARYYGRNPRPSDDTINAILDGLGVNPNTPVIERMWNWLVNLVTQGSLGETIHNTTVVSEIAARAGTSLRLLIMGTIIAAVFGVVLGVWGAVRQYKFSDQAISYASFTILATPSFVVGILLMILATLLNNVLGIQLISFTGEYTAGLDGGWWVQFWDRAVHLLLPTISLALLGAAAYSRYQRSAMLDVLSADYIRTARSKGRTRGSALVRHGVRVALIPMSTYFAYSFATVLAGAAVTELVFSWHGMGEMLVNAITQSDINAFTGAILFNAVLILIAGTLSDIVYAALDPRVRV